MADDKFLVTVDIRDQINDIRAVIDLAIAGLRYASTDVAMAYAEMHAQRGNPRPLAELTRRRALTPLQREPKPWTAEQLDKTTWAEGVWPPSPNVPPHYRFGQHDVAFTRRAA